MKKVNTKTKQKLRQAYEKACNGYLVELLRMWEWDAHYGYFIGDEVGGVYAYADYIFLNMSDIIYCVENDIEEKEYVEWQEYTVFAHEYDQTIPNFPSWHKGCPRLSKEQQDKLIAAKKELNDLIEESKQQTNSYEKVNEKS